MRMEPISRRQALGTLVGLAAAGGLAGCGLFDKKAGPPPPNPLAEHLAATVRLAGVYEAAFAAAPDLTGKYGAIRDDHWAHADALAAATRKPAPSRTPAPTAEAALGRAGLLEEEKKAATAAYEAALTIPGAYAALLGSIAACRATHVEVMS
ncbi:twin-arginine translocation signal domain-containing protein [Longispora sp. K20-0274]|uniref:twin-arginine translocation signal domain-containing protein n=1 Tax=Longispora sp. K20-0274 TaxID=3088255 RepID=UPI00399A8904